MKIDKQAKIYLKGQDKTNDITQYEYNGHFYNVTFTNGNTYPYKKTDVEIVESNEKRAGECLKYLQELASKVGIIDSNSSVNMLSKAYAGVDYTPNSIIGSFLSGTLNNTQSTKINLPIYPFGFNSSQHEAIQNALNYTLSIIEGPPGTGKTQTVLNIIAMAIMNDNSVAIVSSNNAAIQNVLEKLANYHLDFLAAYLGNTDNKKNFIASQKDLPSMINWNLTKGLETTLKSRLQELFSELENKLLFRNNLSRLKTELIDIETEETHFIKKFADISVDIVHKIIADINAEGVLLQLIRLEKLKKPNFFRRLVASLNLVDRTDAIFYKLIKASNKEAITATLQQKFYNLKKQELNKEIIDIENKLVTFDFDSKMSEYVDISSKLFYAKLANRYNAQIRTNYEIDSLKKNSKCFLQDYPIVLSTTHSLRNCLANDTTYDYVIIDEASQVDICTGAATLICAKKVVVVGDLKQLPHVVPYDKAKASDQIFDKYHLKEAYRYKNNNLISCLSSLFKDSPRTLLKEHYRCHPKIIGFCNKKFYNNELIVLSHDTTHDEPLLVYKTNKGNHARDNINRREIDVINQEAILEQRLNLNDGSLGIVTPYRNQTNSLQDNFTSTKVKVDTVDKFQGQEKDVIILSTVDNEITDFTDNANRLNVAISRAKNQLIVVTNGNNTNIDGNLASLIRYIEYHNFNVIDSKINSVFDYLYKQYSMQRKKILADKEKISNYDSENLMHIIICDVLSDDKFNSIDVATHVPLKMILNDNKLLDDKEAIYVNNDLTHVDFLLFDKFDKKPKLVIEVDGVAYHAKGSKQAARDIIKNNVLKKYGLDLLRLATNGSNEREQLIERLSLIVQ